MLVDVCNQKKLHQDLTNVGLRAQATAAGLIQLCIELRASGMLDEIALNRIKAAIGDQIIVASSRQVDRKAYRQEVRSRLDRLFSGEDNLGTAEWINPNVAQTDKL